DGPVPRSPLGGVLHLRRARVRALARERARSLAGRGSACGARPGRAVRVTGQLHDRRALGPSCSRARAERRGVRAPVDRTPRPSRRSRRRARGLRDVQAQARGGLLGCGEADGLLYFVMPCVVGESRRERLDREPQLTITAALRIAGDVAAALGYAHGLGVVHRDIKPENILLADGRALVADFGIARAITAAGSERLTETGIALGTPAYMSPEQATEDGDVDGRSDLYALGCVVYEMRAGDRKSVVEG